MSKVKGEAQNTYREGMVVWADYPFDKNDTRSVFKHTESSKERPCLVLNQEGSGVHLFKITGTERGFGAYKENEIPVKADEYNGLTKDSVIRVDNLVKVKKQDVQEILGCVDKAIMSVVKERRTVFEQEREKRQWVAEVKNSKEITDRFPGAKIYEKPNEGMSYDGEVVHKGQNNEFFALKPQKGNALMLFDAKKLPEGEKLPEKDTHARVSFHGKEMQVHPSRERTNERGHERGSRSR